MDVCILGFNAQELKKISTIETMDSLQFFKAGK